MDLVSHVAIIHHVTLSRNMCPVFGLCPVRVSIMTQAILTGISLIFSVPPD